MDDEVVIGGRGLHLGVLLVVAQLAIAAVPVLFGRPPSLVAVVLAVLTAGGVVANRRTNVRFDDDALVVTTLRGSRRYPWTDILEVSWFAGRGWLGGSGPVLRIRGGPYDEPGPNMPAQVASIVLFGSGANRAAEQQLAQAAERHDVPYTPGLLQLLGRGQRRPRLPSDR